MDIRLLLVTIYCLFCSSAHNILVFLPTPFWSHYMQVEPIFHALALRGHNMTVVSPFPPKNKVSNFTHLQLTADRFLQEFGIENAIEYHLNLPHELLRMNHWKEVADIIIPETCESSVFQSLIHDDNKFDLIFTELYFCQEALVVLGYIFNAPVVTYASFGHRPDILRYNGAANAVAYLQHKELYNAGHLSLIKRLENVLIQFGTMIFNEYWYYPQHDALLAKYISAPLPRITDMLRNVSLYFLTANTAVDGAKLYPPNVIEISGIHFKDPVPLDKELQVIMDTADQGVIFFSFGSLLKATDLRREAVQTFLSTFKELKQTVIWKANLNTSDWDMPKNVYMRDWFDQSSLLAHPNCALFLTHGGVSSMMEAIRHAVPLIGIPFFSDQIINVANAENFGYGLRLAYRNLTRKSLRWAINAVLENSRFKENMKRASKVLTDKPMSSLETAIYWIEYVIRHDGAHHLKPLAAHIPWYELLLLDVIAIYLSVFFLFFYLTMKLVTFSYRRSVFKAKLSKDKTN